MEASSIAVHASKLVEANKADDVIKVRLFNDVVRMYTKPDL